MKAATERVDDGVARLIRERDEARAIARQFGEAWRILRAKRRMDVEHWTACEAAFLRFDDMPWAKGDA